MVSVTVTDRAAEVLAYTLRNGEVDQDSGFRVVPAAPWLIALTIDQAREGDQVVRHGKQTVLLLETWVAYALNGAVLDVEEQAEGASLTLHAPVLEIGS